MNTISIWEGTARRTVSYPRLQGHKEADVVVVGGGITGITAAMLLSDAGKKVILLEAHKIGLGTTGNSTGNLYVTVDVHLSGLKSKWGVDTMRAVVQSRREAIDLIENTVNRHGLDCAFTRTTFNSFCEKRNDDRDDFLKQELEAMNEAWLSANLSESSSLPFPVARQLTLHGQAQFHPYDYVTGLAEKLSGTCEIYENSAMIDFDEKEVVVKTENGSVRAGAVLMATHVPKGNWMVQASLGPYRECGVAAELKSGSCPDGIYWRLDAPRISVRSLRVGNANYVMAVGDKYKTGQGEDTTEYVERLTAFLGERFDLGEKRFVWGGQQYRSADGLPYIGRHSDKMYFLTGFATDGLVYGTLGAMIVSDQIRGRRNRWEDIYALKRFTPVKSFKEFFRENIDNIAQYVKDTPWNVDASAVNKIPAGEGRVMDSGGEKVAVYKDEKGTAHVVSAVCTHMKCVVNWNKAEKTWDCPCHGSRFTTEGAVIEGPAISGLMKKEIKK